MNANRRYTIIVQCDCDNCKSKKVTKKFKCINSFYNSIEKLVKEGWTINGSKIYAPGHRNEEK